MIFNTWQDIFVTVIAGFVLLFGAPITQLFKILLSKIFKKTVEDKWALLLSLIVAGGLGALEMWLTGQFAHLIITPATFPAFLSVLFTVSQVYYRLFNASQTVLGTKALLKPPVVLPITPVALNTK